MEQTSHPASVHPHLCPNAKSSSNQWDTHSLPLISLCKRELLLEALTCDTKFLHCRDFCSINWVCPTEFSCANKVGAVKLRAELLWPDAEHLQENRSFTMQGCQEQKLFKTETKQNLACDDCFCEKSQENLYAEVQWSWTQQTLPSSHFHFRLTQKSKIHYALHLSTNFNSQKRFLWL